MSLEEKKKKKKTTGKLAEGWKERRQIMLLGRIDYADLLHERERIHAGVSDELNQFLARPICTGLDDDVGKSNRRN